MAFPDRRISHLLGSSGPVHALAYSASPGTYILAGSADRSIRLYNPQPGVGTANHNGTSSSSSSSSSHLSKKGVNPAAAATPVPEGRLIQTYSAHGYEVLSLSVSSDNARFASAGGDRSVFLWDVASAQTIRRFSGSSSGSTQGHSARVNSVSFAGEDDSLLVSGGLDASVRVWDVRSGAQKPVQVLADAKDAVTSIAVHGAHIVAGSVDGRVRTYDVRAGRCVADVVGPSVTSLSLTRDGKAMLVGALDSKLRLMDRETGGCLKTYADPGWRNQDLRLQSILGGKEQYVLVGDEMTAAAAAATATATTTPGQQQQHAEGRIWAWDVVTGELKATLRVPWGPPGMEPKRIIGKDGKEKERLNVMSCLAWRDGGFGDQFCVSGTSGVVTVYGYH